MIPFFRLFNNNKQQKAVANSPDLSLKLKGDGNNINQVINAGSLLPTPEQIEAQHFNEMIAQLRRQWLLSNDGITPERAAGRGWGDGEHEWINKQLEDNNDPRRV